jgi:hypothetical protein
MAKKKIIFSTVLILLIVFSTLVYVSSQRIFLFSRELTIIKVSGEPNNLEPEFYFNVTDSGKYVGSLFVRVEPITKNSSSNTVYVDFQHSGNTQLDSIVFRFQSQQVTRVYLDMSDPVSVTYSPSRDLTSYSVKAEFGELGTLQGSNVYQFILYDFGPKSNLYFSAEISMHYMNFLETNALKANIGLNTEIPSA